MQIAYKYLYVTVRIAQSYSYVTVWIATPDPCKQSYVARHIRINTFHAFKNILIALAIIYEIFIAFINLSQQNLSLCTYVSGVYTKAITDWTTSQAQCTW